MNYTGVTGFEVAYASDSMTRAQAQATLIGIGEDKFVSQHQSHTAGHSQSKSQGWER